MHGTFCPCNPYKSNQFQIISSYLGTRESLDSKRITVKYLAYRQFLTCPYKVLNRIEDRLTFKYYLAFRGLWKGRGFTLLYSYSHSNQHSAEVFAAYYGYFQRNLKKLFTPHVPPFILSRNSDYSNFLTILNLQIFTSPIN